MRGGAAGAAGSLPSARAGSRSRISRSRSRLKSPAIDHAVCPGAACRRPSARAPAPAAGRPAQSALRRNARSGLRLVASFSRPCRQPAFRCRFSTASRRPPPEVDRQRQPRPRASPVLARLRHRLDQFGARRAAAKRAIAPADGQVLRDRMAAPHLVACRRPGNRVPGPVARPAASRHLLQQHDVGIAFAHQRRRRRSPSAARRRGRGPARTGAARARRCRRAHCSRSVPPAALRVGAAPASRAGWQKACQARTVPADIRCSTLKLSRRQRLGRHRRRDEAPASAEPAQRPPGLRGKASCMVVRPMDPWQAGYDSQPKPSLRPSRHRMRQHSSASLPPARSPAGGNAGSAVRGAPNGRRSRACCPTSGSSAGGWRWRWSSWWRPRRPT